MSLKKRRVIIILSLTLLLLFGFFLVFEFTLYPLVERAALASSRRLATATVNEAVLEVLSSGALGGEEFIRLEKGEDGSVTSLTSNAEKINLVKALIVREVEKRLSDTGAGDVSIPIGNLTGIKLLSGRGPSLRVRLVPARSVRVDVVSVFLESGINQTWHRLLLKVEADFTVMVLSRRLDCRVSDTVVMSDTVIVGRVPDAYTDINKIEDELLGDVVDFSASSN